MIASIGREFGYRACAVAGLLGVLATVIPNTTRAEKAADAPAPRGVLVIHGGCGVIPRGKMAPALAKQFKTDLENSLNAGLAARNKPKGTSVDMVEAAIRVLEDSELFNAGKGAVFTREGRNELDASIMHGKTKAAGAVASVTTVRNPISAARQVMEKSGHVLMVGEGAERFAESAGCEIVPPHYFWTKFRWDQYQAALREEQEEQEKQKRQQKSLWDTTGSHKTGGLDGSENRTVRASPHNRFGTVGAVALDLQGNLAAGTSTGGLTLKRHGRVGDSPIIGAGNFADNESCAVSATGDGEFFIRAVAAYDICALVKYGGRTQVEASNEVILKKIKNAGGDGAVIVLNKEGEVAMTYNTEGMYRGYITDKGETHVFIYDEELK